MKICLIGTGTPVFARNILSDVLSNAELAQSDMARGMEEHCSTALMMNYVNPAA